MKFLTIEIPEAHDEFGCFDVVDEQGRRCDGLCWDEMLGQVAMLTIPPSRVGHGFGMHTPFEWSTIRAESAKRRERQAGPSNEKSIAEAGEDGLRVIRQVLFGDDSHGGGT